MSRVREPNDKSVWSWEKAIAEFPREAGPLPSPSDVLARLSICNTGTDYGISAAMLAAQQQLGYVRVLPLSPTLRAISPSTLDLLGINWS